MRQYKMYEDDVKKLLEFMYEAHLNTYASERSVNEYYQLNPPVNHGHVEFLYEQGPWKYHDSYIPEGNAPGREIIYYNGCPVWSMAYQGNMISKDFEIVSEVFGFLKEALRNNTIEKPFRGPDEYESGKFKYTFKIIEGDIEGFVGKEEIHYNGELVYKNNILGCCVKG